MNHTGIEAQRHRSEKAMPMPTAQLSAPEPVMEGLNATRVDVEPKPKSHYVQLMEQLSPNICFLHIMKTAGMTLRPFIEQNYARSLAGDPVAVLRSIESHSHSAKHVSPNQALSAYRYLRGHDNYAEIIPDGFIWITLLREPVARIKSLYRFWQDTERHAGDPEETLRMKALANQMPLPDLLAHKHPGVSQFFHNGMCKVLVPSFPVRRCESMTDDQLVQEACRTLDRMACVGTLEQFDDFLRLLCYTMRWVPPTVVQTLNVSRVSSIAAPPAPPPPAESDIIERAVRLDRIVYEYACSLFQRQYARMMEELFDQPLRDNVSDEEVTARIGARARAALIQAHGGGGGTLPAAVSLSMAEPIRGDGWLEREGMDVGRIYRWTGPGLRSTLDLLIAPAREYVIEVRVINVIDPEILRRAMVSVNGVASRYTTLLRNRDWTTFRAIVPGHAVGTDGFAQVQIEVPKTASHLEVHSDCGDPRQKGLAISAIELRGQPAESLLASWKFRAQSVLRRARARAARFMSCLGRVEPSAN